jgi:hypothetical protein
MATIGWLTAQTGGNQPMQISRRTEPVTLISRSWYYSGGYDVKELTPKVMGSI